MEQLTDNFSIKSIESPKQETLFNTSKIIFEDKQAIADAGATRNFILPGSLLNNIQRATRPLVISLPDGKTLKYTYTGNLDLPWPPKASTRAHVVTGLSQTSSVSIKMLCDAYKVSYNKEKCLILYNNTILWQGKQEPSTRFWILPLSTGTPPDNIPLHTSTS